jgi:hypothetical protein
MDANNWLIKMTYKGIRGRNIKKWWNEKRLNWAETTILFNVATNL